MKNFHLLALASFLVITTSDCESFAIQDQQSVFNPGSVIADFGNVAEVKSDVPIGADTVFKIRFDAGKSASPGSINQTFDSVARLLNIQAAAGNLPGNTKIAIVVHGRATNDLLQNEFFRSKTRSEADNGSAAAIATLQDHGVEFYVCGQSAAYHGADKSKLLPGIKIAPSAMTMHAVLSDQGYSLNPF